MKINGRSSKYCKEVNANLIINGSTFEQYQWDFQTLNVLNLLK